MELPLGEEGRWGLEVTWYLLRVSCVFTRQSFDELAKPQPLILGWGRLIITVGDGRPLLLNHRWFSPAWEHVTMSGDAFGLYAGGQGRAAEYLHMHRLYPWGEGLDGSKCQECQGWEAQPSVSLLCGVAFRCILDHRGGVCIFIHSLTSYSVEITILGHRGNVWTSKRFLKKQKNHSPPATAFMYVTWVSF